MAKRIRLATFCTDDEVQYSADAKSVFYNKATKSIFVEMLKSKWTGQDTIKLPIDEFASAVWMTYLLRSPTNKGNVRRDKKGNRVVDAESKKCIHNTDPSYFTALSESEKETRCMQVIKHLRKYFKITDCKTEWTVTHGNFATAKSLNEQVIENILPNRNNLTKKAGASPPSTPRARSKRKHSDSEDEVSSAKVENPKRRRKNSDSDVSSSFSSYSASVVSSPDSYHNPESPVDLGQSPLTPDTDGDFHMYPSQQPPVDLYWYTLMTNTYYFPAQFPVAPALSSWE